MNTLTFKAGQVIFRQGDYAATMYDIIEGRVGVYVDYDTEDEKLLAELGSGDTLGEMGMIEVYPRSATAISLVDDTVLEEIGEDELNEYFRNKPDKLLKIMKQLSKRIRETNEKYVNACRAAYENAEAEKTGAEKSEWLKGQLDAICKEYSDNI